MKILNCYIENFGKLHEFNYEFIDGINIINEKNGWGKSTLATFIKVMFYGFDNSNKRAIDENERKKYYPWQGGKFGGNLEFEINGKRYQIERFFGLKDKEDSFKLYDKSTNMESYDYSEDIGEEIFKIDREGYARSTYIPQQNLYVEINDSLSAKLSNILEGENDINSSEEAINILLQEMKEYKKTGNKGKLNELYEKILNKERELEKARKSEELINERNKKIEETQKRIKELEKQRNENQEALNRSILVDSKIENLNNEIVLLEDKLHSEERAEKLEEKNRKHKNNINKSLSLLLMIISIILGIFVNKYLYLICFLGILLSILTIIKNDKLSSKNESKYTKELINEKKEELESIEKSNSEFSSEKLKRDNDKITLEINNLINQKSYDKNELNRLINTLETVQEIEEDIDNLENEYSELNKKYNILDKTLKFLKKSKEEFSSHYLNGMIEGFEKYFKIINGENIDTNLDIKLNVKIKSNGENKELDYFSTGYKDLAEICIRFALIDALFEDEKPFIILDDPFVNLDKEKIENAKKIVEEFSKKYQVIYFVCHESRE